MCVVIGREAKERQGGAGQLAMREKCVWCGEQWEGADDIPRKDCPRCGRSEWGKEPNYTALGVAESGQYETLAETTDYHRVMWLDLRGVRMTGLTNRVPLTHRLKNTFRKQMDDLRSSDRRGLLIWFGRPHGADGLWEIAITRPPRSPHNPLVSTPPLGPSRWNGP
jgi:hypothetical protein